MRISQRVLVYCTAFFAGACVVSLVSAAETNEGKKPYWKIKGDLEEACTCNAACPCWFGSKPSKMNCGGGQVLFIKKGKYDKINLDGLAIASFGQSPDGESMMESFGNWNFTTLYIDEKASPEQRQALKDIAMKVMPVAASTNVDTRYISFTREIAGNEHKITMGQMGTFYGHLIEGGLGGEPKIVNPPGADPLHASYKQGLTSKLEFNGSGQNWKTKNSNYMYGNFEVDSKTYEKYNAGLAQKMAEMKKEK